MELQLLPGDGGDLIGVNTVPLEEIYYKGGIWINKFVDLFRPKDTNDNKEDRYVQHKVG